mmetsp:Transcript_8213/g.20998  ORF Transcript_8213/g.20998 Transcript_8213/m.20998 type:complete len:187 (+) Transcript_8213:328-888(+)
MTDGELRAAKRDELCAELCRLRRTHPALVAAAAALRHRRGLHHQPASARAGARRLPRPERRIQRQDLRAARAPLMQLCKMRTRAGKQFAIVDFERPTGAAAGAGPAAAGGAGGLAGGQVPTAGASTQPAGTARTHAGEVVARTGGDQSAAARAQRGSSMADAELIEAADESQAKRLRGPAARQHLS